MNKYQELQQENNELKRIVTTLQNYQANAKYYSHSRLKRMQYEQSLRNIDWSLNRNIENIKATSVWCECGRCDGRLLDWSGRSFQIWDNMPGACPFRVAVQLRRIAFHRNEDIDPNIMEKLLKVSRQL